jgi:archaellum component FlaC
MAEELDDGIENALNLVVLTTDRSGNMKKESKQTIYETVSSLRNLFVKLKNNCDVKSSKICELEAEVSKVKTELQRVKRDKDEKGHVERSFIPSQEPAG